MISGIASPLMARPPTMPPAGPTGRWSASTVPSKAPATRAPSVNDMAASGPPSDTARIDFNIENSPTQTDAIKKVSRAACKPILSAGERSLSARGVGQCHHGVAHGIEVLTGAPGRRQHIVERAAAGDGGGAP